LTESRKRRNPNLLQKNEKSLIPLPLQSRSAISVYTGYPSSYRVGMSNLGFHFMYGFLRSYPGLKVERFFANTSGLTIESGSMISRAAVLLFSVSYEEDYINLVRILRNAGIEPLRYRRNHRPVLIVGGAAVSANPAVLSDIADVVVLGEGEFPLQSITECLLGTGGALDDITEKIAAVPGVYVPGVNEGEAAFSPHAEADMLAQSVIITPDTVFGNTFMIETGRGCPGRCSFCLASSIYGPFRTIPADEFDRRLSACSVESAKVGLVSTAVAAHPEFGRIIELLVSSGHRAALSSLRAEDLDSEKIRHITSAGIRSVSLAPETGSERLRFAIGKMVKDDVYMSSAHMLAEGGVTNFNLYLLTGYPGEEDGTLVETKKFLSRFKRAIGNRRLSVHVNFVIPKPWTPLQFFGMPEGKALSKRLTSMKINCSDIVYSIKVKSVRSALRQAVLSLGDGRVGAAIVRYAEGRTSWRTALEAEGLDPEFVHRRRGVDRLLPWEIVEGPVKRDSLLKRFESIIAGTSGNSRIT